MTQTTVFEVTNDAWTEVLPTGVDGVLFLLTNLACQFCAAPDAASCTSETSFVWGRSDELRVPALQGGARLFARALGVDTPAQVARLAPVALGGNDGTRQYNLGAGTRTAVGATSSAAVALGTLGAAREILLIGSTRCHVRFGAADVAAAVAGSPCLPLPADTMFHLRVPAGATHCRVIRDSADGHLSVIPVA